MKGLPATTSCATVHFRERDRRQNGLNEFNRCRRLLDRIAAGSAVTARGALCEGGTSGPHEDRRRC
jgi:hypothetical protein